MPVKTTVRIIPVTLLCFCGRVKFVRHVPVGVRSDTHQRHHQYAEDSSDDQPDQKAYHYLTACLVNV